MRQVLHQTAPPCCSAAVPVLNQEGGILPFFRGVTTSNGDQTAKTEVHSVETPRRGLVR